MGRCQSEKPMMCASITWYAWYVVSGENPAPRRAPSRRVHEGEPQRPDARRRHQDTGRPRVAAQRVVRRDRRLADSGQPFLGARRLHLGEDEVEHAVEEVVLVRDVVVERHRLEPERLPELPHRQRVDPVLVGEREPRFEDPVAVERLAGAGH